MSTTDAKRDLTRKLFVLSLLAGSACGLLQTESLAGAAQAPAAVAPKVIELTGGDVVKVMRGELKSSIELSGSLQPLRQALLSANIEAPVAQVLVRPGQTVKAGQVLMLFDTVQLQNQLMVRSAALEKARASAQMAHKNQERNRDLLARNFISANTADATENAYALAMAQIKEDEAQLAIARRTLHDAVLKAPFAGVIGERFIEPGERPPVSQKLLSLIDLSELEFAAVVDGEDLSQVRVGQRVEVSMNAYAGHQFQGVVERIAPVAQGGSRMVPVYVRLKNDNGLLKAGMFVQGSAVVAQTAAANLLPLNAVRGMDSGKPFVLVVRNGRAERQEIKLSQIDRVKKMAAIDGVRADEFVIIAKLAALKAGDPVKMPQA